MNVVSIAPPEPLTYEQLILEYLGGLSEEEKKQNVSSIVILGLTQYRDSFFSVVKDIPRFELVGILEELKLFLLMGEAEE